VVRAGDTVVWTNEDVVPHTATAKGKGLDSGSIGAKQSWRYTASEKGTYAYDCTFHPNMKGTLVVR
jgi:plastocyanin